MLPLRRIASNGHHVAKVCRHGSKATDTKVVQPPNAKKISTDMIGPPDPVSNLRQIVFKQPVNETGLEKRYRKLRMEVQEWNQKFWTQHNSTFFRVILCNQLPYVTLRTLFQILDFSNI